MTRRINSTTKVHLKRTKTGYTVTIIGGELGGQSRFITRKKAIEVSPRSTVNPRAVGREVIRALRKKAGA